MSSSSSNSLSTSMTATTPAEPVVHKSIQSFREFRRTALFPSPQNPQSPQQQQRTLGFVPTMGALHEGHLSLVETARRQNDVVVVSIFVNPTQFGPNEDFDKYPRQFEEDYKLLSKFGVDHILAPTNNQEMYNPGHVTSVHLDGFDELPEGKVRPGHFDGVATVVTKLLNIVQPTRAYFGQKDAVQCVLIQRLVEDLNMDVDVRIMDTVREHDGLAKSSRNAYLSKEERTAACIIYKSLVGAQTLFDERRRQRHSQQRQMHSDGDDKSSSTLLPSSEIITTVQTILESEPLVSEIQYVSVDDRRTMKPLQDVLLVSDDGSSDNVSSSSSSAATTKTTNHVGAIVSLACKIGSVRLIDNIVLK